MIEVARRLFAHKGLENTTMNDIAEASDKGRRTIYTYFKNKNEIYNAIVETESDALLSRLREVVNSQMEPRQKLAQYLRVRFEVLACLTPSKDYLSTLISSEARRWEKVRKKSIEKELDLFQLVIDEGVRSGEFDSMQAQRLPAVQTVVVQAICGGGDNSAFDALGCSIVELKEKIIDFIIHGVSMKDKLQSATI